MKWQCSSCGAIWKLNLKGLLYLPIWKLRGKCLACDVEIKAAEIEMAIKGKDSV